MKKIFVIGENTKFESEIYNLLALEGYDVELISSFDYDAIRKERCTLILSEIPSWGSGDYFTDLISTFRCKVIAVVQDEMMEKLHECTDAGVHDYIFLPLRKRELLMKIKYLLRKQDLQIENYSGVLFNSQEYKVYIKHEWICMTKNEYRICKTLAMNSELTFSKDHIYENIYDLDKDTQIKTITEYIYSIRKKCKEVAVNPIKTIWGIGYRWNYEECSA